jgi:membrane complex biogenesis BtpA family protein
MIRGLIGMVHLGPLPGSPQSTDLSAILERATTDARVLESAGFDALMIENFGDAPFFPDDVPPVTIASLTRAVTEVSAAVALPVGVNVLRNDARAAVAIAAATGAAFIRVNVLSGSMWTDQGLITGRAAEIARLRAALAPEVSVLADVMVKHATPPPGLTLELAAVDLWERSGADGIIVSGTGTGRPLAMEDLDTLASIVPGAPLYAGSGTTEQTVAAILSKCAGAIVGTATKVDDITTNPVDPNRARRIVEAAH